MSKRVVFYLNCVSPHQMPLAREVVSHVGEDRFRYVYCERSHADRVKLGWTEKNLPDWCVPREGNELMLEEADVVYSGLRDIDLFVRRAEKGRKTFYYSERWFKPMEIVIGQRCRCSIPGWARMLVPSYFKMARRFVKWLNNDPGARYLAIGPWAARDMKLLGVKPGKVVPWGYFVEPSKLLGLPRQEEGKVLRLLWVGRMLKLKRVDDIIRAVAQCVADGIKIAVDVYGRGEEEFWLKRLAVRLKLENVVRFYPPVPIAEVRLLMHDHDVYVFSSNALDGWGAVVSEALEEGMKVVGTYESGASAAILPASNLYHAGDWRRLARILSEDIAPVPIGMWTAKSAAKRMLEMWG